MHELNFPTKGWKKPEIGEKLLEVEAHKAWRIYTLHIKLIEKEMSFLVNENKLHHVSNFVFDRKTNGFLNLTQI